MLGEREKTGHADLRIIADRQLLGLVQRKPQDPGAWPRVLRDRSRRLQKTKRQNGTMK